MIRRLLAMITVSVLLLGCRAAGHEQAARPGGGAPTATAAREMGRATTVAADAMAELDGLPFGVFASRAHDALLARSPERATLIGAANRLGIGHNALDDLSEAHQRDTEALEAAILARLRAYDRQALSREDRLTYDVLEWHLDDAVRGHAYAEHDFSITHCRGGHHSQLISLLTRAHPMDSPEDAEAYVSRLRGVRRQVGQLLDGAERRRAMGVMPPRFILDRTRRLLADYLGVDADGAVASDVDADSLSVYTAFDTRLDDIEGLSKDERARLRAAAIEAIETSFVPAYLDELAYLGRVAELAKDEAGAWALPDGEAYYAHRLRHHATMDVTADDVHRIGLDEVTRVQAELREVFSALGYPEGAELAVLVQRAVEEAGSLPTTSDAERARVVRAWERLVREAETRMRPAFRTVPTADLDVVAGLGGEYYVPAAVGGSSACEFHVGRGASQQPTFMMRTIAYHEAVPGHHYQAGLVPELGLPPVRTEMSHFAYSEGWALYAERLAYEAGLFDGDPHANVGRLLSELLRAARLVTDTGLHAREWTRDEARAYMERTAGAPPGAFDDEVDRMVVAPGLATANHLGMLQILAMRERMQTTLGDAYVPRVFHDAVLGDGSLPIDVLRRVMNERIEAAVSAAR